MNDHLHIVCLDAPAPPDYGGAIDMYYKIKALAASGKKITLHYFNYRSDRGVKGLENDCIAIHAYDRKGLKSLSPAAPFIVSSRINLQLIERLGADDDPILLEGLHCSGLVAHLKNPSRVVLRMHNEEAEYYNRLAKNESGFRKRLYYNLESRLVRKYYRKLLAFNLQLACLSRQDMESFRTYGFNKLNFIPCFLPWQELRVLPGKGDYCLYHGNLKVPENEAAARWLIEEVFAGLEIVLVIAGNGISERLEKLARRCRNIRLIKDPVMEELNALVRDAHIHVLPSMNATGVKLKLLHALFEGRFCISNDAGVKGSAVETLVHLADDAESLRAVIKELYEKEFSEADIKNRQLLLTVYDNKLNADKLNELW
ncbi:MAG: glycosyltransferase [Flavisolibacter sp.]